MHGTYWPASLAKLDYMTVATSISNPPPHQKQFDDKEYYAYQAIPWQNELTHKLTTQITPTHPRQL